MATFGEEPRSQRRRGRSGEGRADQSDPDTAYMRLTFNLPPGEAPSNLGLLLNDLEAVYWLGIDSQTSYDATGAWHPPVASERPAGTASLGDFPAPRVELIRYGSLFQVLLSMP